MQSYLLSILEFSFYFFLILELITARYLFTNCVVVDPSTNNKHENTQDTLFSEIFRQQEHRLYNLALRLTKSDPVAKDILQEVFLKLWEQRDGLQAISNMEAWLYRLTENKIIDYLRKAAADARLKRIIWQHLQQIVDETELHVAAKEYNQVIQKAIDQLPPQRKLIYQLNKEDGLNYRQIAEELHISKHTVKNQLFTAVQSVRQFITRNVKLFSIFF